MSSKRKSPPTKLHEGSTTTSTNVTDYSSSTTTKLGSISPSIRENGNTAVNDVAATDDNLDYNDDESSNLSDDIPPTNSSLYNNTEDIKYKISSDESDGPFDDDEEDLDVDDEIDDVNSEDTVSQKNGEHRSPPNKKQKLISNNTDDNLSLVPSSLVPTLSAIHLQRELQQQLQLEEQQRRNSTGGGSNNDFKSLNNNSLSLNHNSLNSVVGGLQGVNASKRTMDDVLKRLTSKMNHSTIKEENRSPTPSSNSTPNNKLSR
jgi:hypothetical protein